MGDTRDYDFYDFFIEECERVEVCSSTISTLVKIFKVLRTSNNIELKDNLNLLEAVIDKNTVQIPLRYDKGSSILVDGVFCKHIYYNAMIDGLGDVLLFPIIFKIIYFSEVTEDSEVEKKLIELIPRISNTNYS